MLKSKFKEVIVLLGIVAAAYAILVRTPAVNYFSDFISRFASQPEIAVVAPPSSIERHVVRKLEQESLDALIAFFEHGKEAIPKSPYSILPNTVIVASSSVDSLEPEKSYGGLRLTKDGAVLTTAHAALDLESGNEYKAVVVLDREKAIRSHLSAYDVNHNLSLLYAPTEEPAEHISIPLYMGSILTGQDAKILFIESQSTYLREATIGELGIILKPERGKQLVTDFFEIVGEELPPKAPFGFVFIDNRLAGLVVGDYVVKQGLPLRSVKRTPVGVSIQYAQSLAELLSEK